MSANEAKPDIDLTNLSGMPNVADCTKGGDMNRQEVTTRAGNEPQMSRLSKYNTCLEAISYSLDQLSQRAPDGAVIGKVGSDGKVKIYLFKDLPAAREAHSKMEDKESCPVLPISVDVSLML